MKNRLRKELEAMLELHTGDSFTADNVHTLVNGIFAADEGGGFEFVEYDNNAFPYPQTIGSTAPSITGLGPADETMMKTIFIMPNKETDPTATLMIVVDEKEPSTDPKTYQYIYVGNINDLPSDVLTEGSIVNDLTSGGIDKPLSAEQGRTLNSHVNYTTCGSEASDQVKLISDDGFELSTHLRLLVRMTNTNTNNTPKFNINNTGGKDVWYNGSVASDTNTWAAGEVLDVYYDGINYIATTHSSFQNVININELAQVSSFVNINTALLAVPSNLRKINTLYAFRANNIDYVWYYTSLSFDDTNWGTYDSTRWRRLDSFEDVRITFLNYTTDTQSTRARVPQDYRLPGHILIYYNGTSWVIEQNIFNYAKQVDANWLSDTYWRRIATTADIASLQENLDTKILKVNKNISGKEFQKSIKTVSGDSEYCLRGYAYNGTTGSVGVFDNNKAYLTPIQVSQTAVYKYTGIVRLSSEPGIVYVDENFNVISTELVGTGSNVQHTDYTLTVPYNAKFILVSCAVYNSNFKLSIEDFDSEFYNKKQLVEELYDSSTIEVTWESGYNGLNSTGTLSTRSSGKVSEFIEVDKNKIYYLSTRVDQYRVGLHFYKSDGTSLGTLEPFFEQSSSTIIKHSFKIPKDATKIRICTTQSTPSEPTTVLSYYSSIKQSVNKNQGTDNAGKVLEINEDGIVVPSQKGLNDFVEKNQGIAGAGKFLKVGEDGNVTLGDGSSSPTDITNCIQNKQNKTIYLGNDILTGVVGSGTGWSYNNGSYTHSSGSTNPLVFALSTIENQSYIVSFTTNTGNFGELEILISIGDKYFCDPYNGTTGPFYIGIKSDGGYLKITPASSYTGTISNVTLKPIVSEESSVTSIVLSSDNVEANTMTSDITSWWNVAIGATNALKKSENSSRNIAIGHNSLSNLENGERNIGIGTFSLLNLKYGHCNICIGADTLYTNYRADYNVAIGKAAMCYMHTDMSIPYYSKNTAVGQGAMSGRGQTFTENVAIGSGAMSGEIPTANSSRINNVAIGANAGANAKVSNVAIGYQAGYYADTGNVVAGYRAGYYNKGNYNVFLGFNTGETYVNNNNCIFIGKGAKAATGSESASNVITIDNSIVIGTDVVSDKSNQILIGSSTQTELIIMGKKIKFNNDNTVTWETVS